MKFNKICIVGINELQLSSVEELQSYSELPVVFYDEIPESTEVLIDHIADADCVLIGVSVYVPGKVFSECTSLKYVGVFARALSRVDLHAAKENKVLVTNIVNWCDWETAEFVIASILTVFRGVGSKHWVDAPQCLKGKQLGIIGLGEVGLQVAEFAKAFGMKIVYHNRREKKDAEELGIEYLTLHELMKTSDIVSLHVPPDSKVLGDNEFEITPDNSVILNTSVGDILDSVSFEKWISKPSHFAIFDRIAGEETSSFKDLSNVYIADVDAYLTPGVNERRIRRLLDNVKLYLHSGKD